jgi:hypothetical protein
LGDEVANGYGVAAAVTLGLATLFVPFSTLLFAHVPAASLAFAAFAILWLRDGQWAALAAGVLAGTAVTVEYPLALAAFGLGLYVVTTRDFAARGLTYIAGLAIGVNLSSSPTPGPPVRRCTSRTRTRCRSPVCRRTSAGSSA